MLSSEDRDVLARIRHSLGNVARYVQVIDQAENLRHGHHPAQRSPIAREMSLAVELLDRMLAPGPAAPSDFGDLLAAVTVTDEDPAHVREGMDPAAANELLRESLMNNGTSEDEARQLANLYVPVIKDTRTQAQQLADLARDPNRFVMLPKAVQFIPGDGMLRARADHQNERVPEQLPPTWDGPVHWEGCTGHPNGEASCMPSAQQYKDRLRSAAPTPADVAKMMQRGI